MASTTSNAGDLSTKTGVRAYLTEWIESHGGIVYWREQPSGYSQPTFSLNNKQRIKPYMVAVVDEMAYPVEVEVGDSYGDVYDGAMKAVKLSLTSVQNDTMILAGGKSYAPYPYLLATKYSPFGHLFPPTDEFLYLNSVSPKLQNDTVPKHEGSISQAVLRLMWRFSKLIDDTLEEDYSSMYLGLLLSSTLESLGDQENLLDESNMVRASDVDAMGSPAVFQKFNGHQEWELLSDGGSDTETESLSRWLD